MRILFVSNYYPPSRYGWGYMQLCEEVADGLAARGHELAVLASTRRDGAEPQRPYVVHRLLRIEPDWQSAVPAGVRFFVGRRARERRAIGDLERLVASFRPDAIMVWHAIGLPRALLQRVEAFEGVPVAYYLAGYLPELPDEYLAYWQAKPVSVRGRLAKSVAARVALRILAAEGRPIRLRYEHVLCVSEYVRQRLVSKGLIPADSVVVHNGIHVEDFAQAGAARDFAAPLRLLYAGRLEPDKGVHEILEALGLLGSGCLLRIGRLTIVGDGDTAYVAQLHAIVRSQGLSSLVRFCPPVPRTSMPSLLAEHDVLIFPSRLEALSRMLQEAMASGLLVIGTAMGGDSELLVHEETGLVFGVGNAASLAKCIRGAMDDPMRAQRLAEAGRLAVVTRFDIQCTVEAVERYLAALVEPR